MYSCKKASLLISQAKEQKLTLNEIIQLKLHLMLCSKCRQFKQNINAISMLCKNNANQDKKK